MFKQIRSGRPALAVACAAALALLTACGSDDSSGETSTSSAATATGKPIVLGFLNTEGQGAISSPEVTTAAKAAVEEVNADGGIDGRPLELQTCPTNGSPESTVSCTNKFVQSRVTAILNGVDLGIDAALPIAKGAGIPLMGVTAGNATGADHAYFQFGPPPATISVAAFKVLKEQGKTNVVQINPNVAGAQQVFKQFIQPAAEAAGVDVSLATYDPAAPDFAAVVQAAASKDADAVLFGGAEPACTAFVQAAKARAFAGTLLVGSCTEFITQLGAQAAGTQTLGYLWVPLAREAATGSKAEQLETYVDAMEGAGLEDKANGFASYGFAIVMDAAQALREVSGPIDAASFAQTLEGLSGFDAFLGEEADCASRPPKVAACSDGFLVYEVTDEGTLDVVGGDFINAGV